MGPVLGVPLIVGLAMGYGAATTVVGQICAGLVFSAGAHIATKGKHPIGYTHRFPIGGATSPSFSPEEKERTRQQFEKESRARGEQERLTSEVEVFPALIKWGKEQGLLKDEIQWHYDFRQKNKDGTAMENMFWNDLSESLAGTSTGRLDNNFFARNSQIGNGALQIEGTNASRNLDMMENNFKQDLRSAISDHTIQRSPLDNALLWSSTALKAGASANMLNRKNIAPTALLYELHFPQLDPLGPHKRVVNIIRKKTGHWIIWIDPPPLPLIPDKKTGKLPNVKYPNLKDHINVNPKEGWKLKDHIRLPKGSAVKIRKFVEVTRKYGRHVRILAVGVDAARITFADDRLKTSTVVSGEWTGSLVGGSALAWTGFALGSLAAPAVAAVGGAVGLIVGAGYGAKFMGVFVEENYDALKDVVKEAVNKSIRKRKEGHEVTFYFEDESEEECHLKDD